MRFASLSADSTDLTENIKQTLSQFVIHVLDNIPGKNAKAGKFLEKELAIKHILECKSL